MCIDDGFRGPCDHRASRACTASSALLVAALWISAPHSVAADTSDPAISWRVENPFRLFTSSDDTERHRSALLQIAANSDSPILAVERHLASAATKGWSADMFGRWCWSQARQTYECDTREDFAHPRVHRVLVRLESGVPGACRWHVEPRGTRLLPSEIVSPCSAELAVDIPWPEGATVGVVRPDGTAGSSLVQVEDLFIVGIGDSFASGDGNPDRPVAFDDTRSLSYHAPPGTFLDDYPARTGDWRSISDPTYADHSPRWMSAPCHRSLYGHQVRAALHLALDQPHRAVTFASFACWGSAILDGVLLPQKASDFVPGIPRLSQLEAVARLQCGAAQTKRREWSHGFDQGGRLPELTSFSATVCPAGRARRIDVVMVSIGGNDIGFARLVANAVLSNTSLLRTIGGWLGQLHTADAALSALPSLGDRMAALNRAIRLLLHVPWSQSQRIVLTAYPPVTLYGAAGTACPPGQGGMTLLPDLALDSRRAADSERVGERLNLFMRATARKLGWTYVEEHRQRFTRHGFCAGTVGPHAAPADEVRLPRLRGNQWRPYPPSQWEPYASRQRWIRTPDDGYLTTNFHVGKLGPSPMNLLLAGTYSGGFHPTAEGQAVIADAALRLLRRVVDRSAR